MRYAHYRLIRSILLTNSDAVRLRRTTGRATRATRNSKRKRGSSAGWVRSPGYTVVSRYARLQISQIQYQGTSGQGVKPRVH